MITDLKLKKLDISQIKDLSEIFKYSLFNGDVSKWDLSSCTNMNCIFENSEFNNDSLNFWNLSKVKNIDFIFYKSKFNGDISDWNVSNITTMRSAFDNCPFDGDTNEFKKKIAFLFKFFNEIFVSLKQCGLNYVISNRFSLLESLIN